MSITHPNDCGEMAASFGRTRRSLRILALAALLGLSSAAEAVAVSVSPMSLFIDHRSRTGTITLFNPNPLPEEIEISFAFGYPQSDSAGTVSVPLSDSAAAGEPSAVPWLRAFPRRLILQPGQQQVVRILAQPPAGLPDGEFWARILVTATGGRPPIEQQVQPDVRVAISMRTIVVASLNYRKGPVSTGVAARATEVRKTPEGLEFTIDLERQGDAAYLGKIRAELVSPDGKVHATDEDIVSVYRTLRRRFLLRTETIPPGSVIRYTLETERPDLAPGGVLTSPPVTGTVAVR